MTIPPPSLTIERLRERRAKPINDDAPCTRRCQSRLRHHFPIFPRSIIDSDRVSVCQASVFYKRRSEWEKQKTLARNPFTARVFTRRNDTAKSTENEWRKNEARLRVKASARKTNGIHLWTQQRQRKQRMHSTHFSRTITAAAIRRVCERKRDESIRCPCRRSQPTTSLRYVSVRSAACICCLCFVVLHAERVA